MLQLRPADPDLDIVTRMKRTIPPRASLLLEQLDVLAPNDRFEKLLGLEVDEFAFGDDFHDDVAETDSRMRHGEERYPWWCLWWSSFTKLLLRRRLATTTEEEGEEGGGYF